MSERPDAAADAVDLDRRLAALPDLESRIALTRECVGGRIVFSTSLGLEDQAILHAVATVGAAFEIVTLDTGRLFPETLDTLAASERRYDRPIRVLAPDAQAAERLVARDGIMGFRESVAARQACCAVRKIEPLRRGLAGASGWVAGLRRGQSAGRSQVPFAALDPAFGVLKINPLADWTEAQLEAYLEAANVPLNPLHRQGFPSVGCQTCTRAVAPGEDIRAGRWWWEREGADPEAAGKECGLHFGPGGLRRANPGDRA